MTHSILHRSPNCNIFNRRWARCHDLGVQFWSRNALRRFDTAHSSWLLVTVFTFPVALSLAEISSKYPMSAGAYYWCFRLASRKSRVMLSWVSGWLGLIGTWTVCLSVTLGER